MTSTRILLALGIALIPAAAGGPQAPQRLSETGLYAKGGQVSARNLHYAPQYPLWTDGAAKDRWIQLPKGSTIDASDEDAWKFPVGTKLWKEFAFAGRKVETRLMWRATATEWVFASYRWNERQTDAERVSAKGERDVAEVGQGKRHSIPSLSDCKSCHDNAGTEVLGFTALQLSPERDPGALHGEPFTKDMVDLNALHERGLIRGERKDLVSHPPRIPGDAALRPLLGYLTSNCGTCHRADAPLPELNLDLRHTSKSTHLEMEPAHRTALGQRGQYVIPGEGTTGSFLLAPGNPAGSSVLHRMITRDPDVQMPPLGTVLPDGEALKGLRAWIEGLPAVNH